MEDRTHGGRKFRLLNVVDEFTHECLALQAPRKLRPMNVIDALSKLFILRGIQLPPPGRLRRPGSI